MTQMDMDEKAGMGRTKMDVNGTPGMGITHVCMDVYGWHRRARQKTYG
jgi:hypothetical protein